MAKKSDVEKSNDLYARWKWLKDKHTQLRLEMKDRSDQYFLRHWLKEGEAKEGEERVTLPTQANTVDMAYALLLSQKQNVRVIPTRQTTESQNTSSELEKFLNGVLYVNRLRAKEDRVALALWNALVKKMGWIRYRWDEDLAQAEMGPDMPAQESPMQQQAPFEPPPAAPMMTCKECPIVIDNVAPENMFVKWGGRRGIMYLFYSAKRRLEEVEAEIGQRIRMEPWRSMSLIDRQNATVDFLEYWGWENGKLMTATMVDDRFIPKRKLREATGYDDIPYIPLPCLRTGEEAPHLRVRGVLDNMGSLVHLEERLLAKQNHQLHMFALMPLIANDGSGPPIEFDASLGNVVHVKEDQKVGFPEWPGTPPDFKWHLGVIEDKVQETGFPAVSYGKGPGELSGYAIGQYSEGGRMRLSIPRSNLALALTTLFQGIVSLCVNFAPDLAIPVFGKHKNEHFYTTLTGDQMKGHIIQVDIGADLPGDEMKKAVIGGQLKAQNVLSERTIMEKYLGVEQPEDEIQQMLREQAAKHPVAKLISLARALHEDDDPFYKMVVTMILQAVTQMGAGASPEVAAQQGAAAGKAGPPPARPLGAPGSVVPAMAQGQVLNQEVGMPPTKKEVMEG